MHERKRLGRQISEDEVAVISAALDDGVTRPTLRAMREDLERLQVVAGCTCGCASVDFVEADEGRESAPIADAMGQTARGGSVGVIVWGTPGEITGLEIYDLGADDDDLRLPVPSSIRPLKDR